LKVSGWFPTTTPNGFGSSIVQWMPPLADATGPGSLVTRGHVLAVDEKSDHHFFAPLQRLVAQSVE
jgi:hypothetical protein